MTRKRRTNATTAPKFRIGQRVLMPNGETAEVLAISPNGREFMVEVLADGDEDYFDETELRSAR